MCAYFPRFLYYVQITLFSRDKNVSDITMLHVYAIFELDYYNDNYLCIIITSGLVDCLLINEVWQCDIKPSRYAIG